LRQAKAPLLAGQEKTFTSPSHSESAEEYTISNEEKADRRNRSKEITITKGGEG